MSNIRFENVKLFGQRGPYLIQLEGADPNHTVQDVLFRDVSLLESPLNESSSHVQIRDHVESVEFRR